MNSVTEWFPLHSKLILSNFSRLINLPFSRFIFIRTRFFTEFKWWSYWLFRILAMFLIKYGNGFSYTRKCWRDAVVVGRLWLWRWSFRRLLLWRAPLRLLAPIEHCCCCHSNLIFDFAYYFLFNKMIVHFIQSKSNVVCNLAFKAQKTLKTSIQLQQHPQQQQLNHFTLLVSVLHRYPDFFYLYICLF